MRMRLRPTEDSMGIDENEMRLGPIEFSRGVDQSETASSG